MMMIRSAVMLVGLLTLAEPAQAQGSKVSSPVELARASERLKPGQWVWAPGIAPKGPITIYVDLSAQLATVYRNGVRIGVSTVSSGKPGHETPTGVFTILQKDAKHRSSTYDNAAMPYTQRLTWGGIALHAGGVPGYPESHGCVHLPMTFARELFDVEHLGGTVVITGKAGAKVHGTRLGVVQPGQAELAPLAPGQAFRWQPHRGTAGPISIVVSRVDQQAIVLQSGVEIGRTPVRVPREETDTQVYTMAPEGDHWLSLSLPGHEGAAPVPGGVESPVNLPPLFYAQLKMVLTPGATMLVTSAPLSTGAVGSNLVVLSAGKR